MVEKSKKKGESELLEKREKLMIELEKIRKRVAEFAEYGELDMMVQYVNDVRAVQKRLVEASETINFINKVFFAPKILLALLYISSKSCVCD